VQFEGLPQAIHGHGSNRRFSHVRAGYLGCGALGKEVVYQQLWDVLSGKEPYGDFKHLTAADRRAIREILRVTKPGLPEYWK
jgi:hypothetical protein